MVLRTVSARARLVMYVAEGTRRTMPRMMVGGLIFVDPIERGDKSDSAGAWWMEA